MTHRSTLLSVLLAATFVLGATACDGSDSPTAPAPGELEFQSDFTLTDENGQLDAAAWEYGFANYSPLQEEIMEFAAGHEPLPAPLVGDPGEGDHGLFIGATNRSDDVFMFWTSRMDGLEPGATYQVRFRVRFATDSPAGCVGIGGPPGEAVWVKAGASSVRPEAVLVNSGQAGYWQMNIDKGNQSVGGQDAIILGDVANTASECVDERVWEMKTLESADPFQVTAADDGSIWFIVGTDSGFEGRTELYYTQFEAVLDPE